MSFIKPPPMPPAVPSSSLPSRDEMALSFAKDLIRAGHYAGQPSSVADHAYGLADAMIKAGENA